jgi:CheY-like chemotaxis protein
LPKPKSKQKRQLIVIDPDPAVIDLIGRHLTAFEIIQIKDCNQVMAAIAQLHPYAIIYNAPPDEPLPTSLKAIRQVPVIELSLPSQAWTTNALAVTGSLAKPIRAKQLVQAIELVGGVQDILVIDDDRGFCQLVTRILAATNGRYRIRRAYDGHEGLDAMRIQRPDLVLLDLIMPEMDGFQVLEVMRQDPNLNHLPVLLLTATNYAEDVLSQRCSKLSVFRSDGLRSSELLACLHCMIEHIEPHYDEKTIPTPSET